MVTGADRFGKGELYEQKNFRISYNGNVGKQCLRMHGSKQSLKKSVTGSG